MTRSVRVQLTVAVVGAFFCGLIFASGFDLTQLSWAQVRTSAPARPPAAAVKSLEETSSAFEAIADHVTPAVVAIEAEQLEPRNTRSNRAVPPGMEDFFRRFDPDQNAPRSGTGSGFIVTADGYILTNNHVVANADRVTVSLLDNRRFPAKVIGRDPTTDVALLKVEATNLPVVAMGDDRSARVGQWVVAIGNPLGLDFTVTAGIISAKGRLLNLPNREQYAIQDFIQTDAAINPGNSGGPLVNIRGEVIGINSAIASATGYNAGYGFAVPITLAKQVMEDLREFGRVRRAVLGVSIVDVSPSDARAAGLTDIRGAKVQSFEPAPEVSPARKAGIEVGDLITAAGGIKVNRVSELQRVVRGYKPGEVVDIEVMRFGEKKNFKVRLIEPEPTEDDRVATADRPSAGGDRTRADARTYDKLGITVQPVPAEIAAAGSVREEYKRGLMVTAVSSRGPAYRELFPNQDIILRALRPSREIRSAADLETVVTSAKRGDILTLVVYSLQLASTKVVNIPIQ